MLCSPIVRFQLSSLHEWVLISCATESSIERTYTVNRLRQDEIISTPNIRILPVALIKVLIVCEH